MTEDQAQEVDWLVRLAQFDVTNQDFQQHREQLSTRFGCRPSTGDVVWRILNILTVPRQSPGTRWRAYQEMATQAYQEGKDPRPYLVEAHNVKLQVYDALGVKFVRVVSYSHQPDASNCDACGRLHGRKLSLSDAMGQMPIPSACEGDWCRCDYISEEEWQHENAPSKLTKRQLEILSHISEQGLP